MYLVNQGPIRQLKGRTPHRKEAAFISMQPSKSFKVFLLPMMASIVNLNGIELTNLAHNGHIPFIVVTS